MWDSLRHSSTTYKLKLNHGDLKATQGDTGHAEIDMITSVYAHILDEDRKINAQKFESAFYAKVYQYAAGTKEETLAGLKEIVLVIRDRQTREIVESTIRKLDAIPEPECRRFIADTKQRFIQKRDNSIRRRLAEAKAQARTEKPHPKRKEPDRERS